MSRIRDEQRDNLAVPALLLLAAVLFWLGVFALYLHFSDSGLTLFFEVPPEASGSVFQFHPEGLVRLADSRLSDDGEELEVRLEQIGYGEAQASLLWEGIEDDDLYEREIKMTIWSLPMGILFDSITWNFTGWEVFTVCLVLLLFSAALIFYYAFCREKKRVCFSYRATAQLGFAIFFLVASLLRVDMLLSFIRGENAGTVWSLLVSTIVTAQTFMRRTAFVIVGFALLVAGSNLVLIRHEGARLSNMLGIGVSALMVGGAALGIGLSRSMLTFPLRNVLVNVFAGLFVYMECLLAATIIRSVEAGRHEPDYDRDYVLVLGCKIRPDGTLYPLIRGRVDRAIAFVNAQLEATGKRAILIPSGGQGPDEPISEAEGMARYMLEQGVPEEYILPENKSKTTRENMLFSRKLIDERGEGSKAAFSTSSYHVYRGGILAAEEGWNIDGMGSKTKWYFWPNAFLREFIGLLAASRFQQLTAVLIITFVIAMMTELVM